MTDPVDAPAPPRPGSTGRVTVWRQTLTGGRSEPTQDSVATEEPMEIRLIRVAASGDEAPPESVSVTMRTPGNDFELAAGFLFAEGIIAGRDAIGQIAYCTDPDVEQEYNIVNVTLRAGVEPAVQQMARNFVMNSACGICGKASLDAIHVRGCPVLPTDDGVQVEAAVLAGLPDRLRAAQPLFRDTGGIHAAGMFTLDGELVTIREDVGRHNAVDKLIGYHLLNSGLPLSDGVLVLSGRSSFELIQKALVAGGRIVASVGAPSSLAVNLARDFNMTLAGFTRPDSFNVYAVPERITG